MSTRRQVRVWMERVHVGWLATELGCPVAEVERHVGVMDQARGLWAADPRPGESEPLCVDGWVSQETAMCVVEDFGFDSTCISEADALRAGKGETP